MPIPPAMKRNSLRAGSRSRERSAGRRCAGRGSSPWRRPRSRRASRSTRRRRRGSAAPRCGRSPVSSGSPHSEYCRSQSAGQVHVDDVRRDASAAAVCRRRQRTSAPPHSGRAPPPAGRRPVSVDDAVELGRRLHPPGGTGERPQRRNRGVGEADHDVVAPTAGDAWRQLPVAVAQRPSKVSGAGRGGGGQVGHGLRGGTHLFGRVPRPEVRRRVASRTACGTWAAARAWSRASAGAASSTSPMSLAGSDFTGTTCRAGRTRRSPSPPSSSP